MSFPKTLPNSPENEAAILGAVLMEPTLLDELAGRITTSHFYAERNQLIFAVMQHLWPEPGVDLLTVRTELEARGQLAIIGGVAYLTGLDLDLPDIGRIDAYVEIVRNRALRRRAIQFARHLTKAAANGEGEIMAAVSTAMIELDEMLSTNSSAGFRPLTEWIEPFLARLDGGDKGVINGATSGIPTLDTIIGALQANHLWMIGAYPRVGKTVLLEQVLDRETATGRPIGFISLEMTAEEVLQRQISRRVKIPHERIRSNRFSNPEVTRISRYAAEQGGRGVFYIEEQPGLNIEEICARIRKLKRQNQHLRLVGLDYLALVERGDNGGREDLAILRLTRKLKNLSKELGICTLVACQLNRGGARGEDKPQLADLKDAGEQDADGVILLYRAKSPENRALLLPEGSITVAKHRHGSQGEVSAMLDGQHMQWVETTDRYEGDPS